MPHVPGLSPLASDGSARDLLGFRTIYVDCEPAERDSRHI